MSHNDDLGAGGCTNEDPIPSCCLTHEYANALWGASIDTYKFTNELIVIDGSLYKDMYSNPAIDTKAAGEPSALAATDASIVGK